MLLDTVNGNFLQWRNQIKCKGGSKREATIIINSV